MTDYSDHTTQELFDISAAALAEIERRKREAGKPEMVKDPDLTDLKNVIQGYIDYVASDDYCDDNDYADYIFEAAVMAFFGNDVFKWINGRAMWPQ